MSQSIFPSLLQLALLFLQMLCVKVEGSALVPSELAPVPCNDKAVEKLSRLALTYVNEDRANGYKFALNRIANVHLHAQGPAGNVYYLDLDVLETKCYIGSPKPWKRCDVRPFMETQISGNCNTTILHTSEGYSYLYSYDCTLVPDPAEKLQQTCPTCPVLLPVDSQQAVLAVQLALASYKSQSTLAAGLGVKRITRAAEQTMPVKARFVEFTVHECPEGVREKGNCQRLTPASDTEVCNESANILEILQAFVQHRYMETCMLIQTFKCPARCSKHRTWTSFAHSSHKVTTSPSSLTSQRYLHPITQEKNSSLLIWTPHRSLIHLSPHGSLILNLHHLSPHCSLILNLHHLSPHTFSPVLQGILQSPSAHLPVNLTKISHPLRS
ncbi:fetuin-B isoform X2 [Syngnathus acus]|uniref:fetuin-B isoform X2 n=1 Tax=Syngnathus acus TaxID=161584 RepID=UPI0018863ACA|nr:fetuin-B isoform X2 [Syngnathus acus]